jgi:hypothetical protein
MNSTKCSEQMHRPTAEFASICLTAWIVYIGNSLTVSVSRMFTLQIVKRINFSSYSQIDII